MVQDRHIKLTPRDSAYTVLQSREQQRPLLRLAIRVTQVTVRCIWYGRCQRPQQFDLLEIGVAGIRSYQIQACSNSIDSSQARQRVLPANVCTLRSANTC